ncbi:MAG: SDR family oxidoreductase [Lacisediminihabitans sp.]
MSQDVAIVLGAAGGIGVAVMRSFAESGLCVVGVDCDGPGLDRARDAIVRGERLIVSLVGDVAEEEVLREALDVAEALGELITVVHCAGVVDREPLLAGSLDRWSEVLRVNVLSTMAAIRAFCPALERSARGDLIIVGSVSSRIHYVGEPAYLASKHAIASIAELLRLELVNATTRVTLVQPGLVRTPLTDGVAYLDEILGKIEPLDPSDVANAVAFALAVPRRVTVNEIVLRPSGQLL